MTVRDPSGQFESEADAEGEGFDFDQLKEWLGFTWRATRRRRKLVCGVFGVVAGLGLTVAAIMPRVYNVEVKLLAQRNLVLPALSNSAVPRDADNPTRNVADTILRRDNVVALVKQADLVDRFYATRSPALRFKDRLMGWMGGGVPTERDKLRGLVATLEKKLTVKTDDATVTISVDWPDPQVAYDLLMLVQKNFLEARYDSDIAVVTDAISVLDDHAKAELQQVDTALDEYQKAEAENAKLAAATALTRTGTSGVVTYAPRPAAVAVVRTEAINPEIAQALEDKRQAIRAREAEWHHQLDDAKQALAQAELTLTPLHPTVIGLQQKVDLLSQTPADLVQAKNDERALMAQMAPPVAAVEPAAASAPAAAGLAAGAAAPAAAVASRPSVADASAAKQPVVSADSASIALSRSKLESAIHRYQDVMARIDSAKMELDITRAAFKYQYIVVTPAEVPKGPKKPIPLFVAIGSIIAAVLFGVGSAALADLMPGRIIETWQIRRRLKLDVLAELDPPA